MEICDNCGYEEEFTTICDECMCAVCSDCFDSDRNKCYECAEEDQEYEE